MIILTGSTGGIGSEIINKLSELDDILAIYNSSKPLKDNFMSEKIIFYKLDITSEEEICSFVDSNKSILSKITIVNLAGFTSDGLLVSMNKIDWDKIISTNLTANFLLSKYLIPIMIKQKWGRIIHISSIASGVGVGAYSSSKQALQGLSKSISKEYARFNITSNILRLGIFDTGMFNNLSDKEKNKYLRKLPSKKIGETSNIVNAISFLISSEFVNGSSITIDGGAS